MKFFLWLLVFHRWINMNDKIVYIYVIVIILMLCQFIIVYIYKFLFIFFAFSMISTMKLKNFYIHIWHKTTATNMCIYLKMTQNRWNRKLSVFFSSVEMSVLLFFVNFVWTTNLINVFFIFTNKICNFLFRDSSLLIVA